MLDAFIIEEIKRRERLRKEQERPTADLPVPEDRPKRRSDTEDEERPQRGVVVIDLSV
ncbi:MAG: hypothetical protein ACOZIN_13845 [Myxococcota bacterium]